MADEFAGSLGLLRGVELFNGGEFWEAHEAWEEVWMPHRHRPGSEFFKGLIQCAAGFHHLKGGNSGGALIKWASGSTYLQPFLPAAHGLRLDDLVKRVDEYRVAVAAGAVLKLTPPRITMLPGR
jgi:predicted metal-dependent hydrolase